MRIRIERLPLLRNIFDALLGSIQKESSDKTMAPEMHSVVCDPHSSEKHRSEDLQMYDGIMRIRTMLGFRRCTRIWTK